MLVDEEYPGYTGVLYLCHNITKHVIVKWIGLDDYLQDKSILEQTLLTYFKGIGEVSSEKKTENSINVDSCESDSFIQGSANLSDVHSVQTEIKDEPTDCELMLVDEEYPGCTGVLYLCHNITQHVIVKWIGLDDCLQDKSILEQTLLTYFKDINLLQTQVKEEPTDYKPDIVLDVSSVRSLKGVPCPTSATAGIDLIEDPASKHVIADPVKKLMHVKASPLSMKKNSVPLVTQTQPSPTDKKKKSSVKKKGKKKKTSTATAGKPESSDLVEDETDVEFWEDVPYSDWSEEFKDSDWTEENASTDWSCDDVCTDEEGGSKSAELTHQCTFCMKYFQTESAVAKHKKTHRRKCHICGKSCKSASLLKNHQKSHAGDMPCHCQTCGKGFSSKDTLHHHNKVVHATKRHFQCEFCGKLFNRKHVLDSHRASHTGEKSYECPVCNKLFGAPSSLHIHKKTHTGVKPYLCTICDKRFVRKNTLERHMRIHTGDNPYVCTICSRAFNQRGNLKTHMKTHRGEKAH